MPSTGPSFDPSWIRRFRAAQTPQDLADLFLPGRVKKADRETREHTLRTFLGNVRYEQLAERAAFQHDRKRARSRGNVVLLPGVMGSELSVGSDGEQWKLWVNYWYLYRGYMTRLELDDAGTGPGADAGDDRVQATGLLNEYYGDLLLRLGESFDAKAFPYDWRLPLADTASQLKAFVNGTFGAEAEVMLVAHSMGGLVARSLMAQSDAPKITRLIMLGTPNYGSFEVPLIFSALQDTVKDLIRLTGGISGVVSSAAREQAKKTLLHVLDTFPAIYDMLPVEDVPGLGLSSSRRILNNRAVYKDFNDGVSETHLQEARKFQSSIAAMIDPERMVYVAGYNRETVAGILDPDALDDYTSYEITLAGDGRVPHSLGLLAGVPSYFVDSAHGDLPRDRGVLREIEHLLLGEATNLPSTAPRGARSAGDLRAMSQAWAARKAIEDREADSEMLALMQRLPRPDRSAADSEPADPNGAVLEQHLVKNIFGQTSVARDPSPPTEEVAAPVLRTPPPLLVRLVYGNIATIHEANEPDPVASFNGKKNGRLNNWKQKPQRPITLDKDVIGLGRYVGVRPFSALSDLDQRISAFLYEGPAAKPGGNGRAKRSGVRKVKGKRLYLQEMIDRGLLRGDLGSPSLIPDPRDPARRMLALMGMGTAGQYGEPEARLVARELVWVLGQAGKKHLATTVFGAGRGNLGPAEATRAFMEGAAEAIQSEPRDDLRLQTLTFVEYYGDRVRELDEALRELPSLLASSVRVEYTPYTEAELEAISHRDEARLREERKVGRTNKAAPAETTVRVVSELVQEEFWFSALTNNAAVPQRQSTLPFKLIADSNNRVVAANLPTQQVEAGRALFKCIPRDLRQIMRSGVPIVMEVDSNTARIHWEMLYRHTRETDGGDFLGLERGFTRQLRTTFAPAPEPPTSRRRVLKVLVVADPAADMPLEGARREGEEIVSLFAQFNQHAPPGFRINVTAMIGPDAQYADVMHKLLDGQFDILHYAGHCFFDGKNPSSCGWIFTGDPRETLSVRELHALDAIPPFIFANACESGITPYRRDQRQSGMAPAFAEAFFQQGVRDFLCTAWPVGDAAARVFALTFYSRMLGMKLDSTFDNPVCTGRVPPTDMVRAVREARLATLKCGSGLTTWGAYQHYGNPYTRFLDDDIAYARALPSQSTTNGQDTESESKREATFERAQEATRKYATLLHSIPGVVAVRAGYRFENGWITDEPAVVVAVLDKLLILNDDHRVPTHLDGIRVDVIPATPQEQIQALAPAQRRRLGLPEVILDDVDEADMRKAAPLLKYPKAPQLLPEFNEKINVLCNVSPDNGWPVLEKFLAPPIKELTVAMYDFTAPHIRERMLEALGSTGKLTLVLCPATGGAIRPAARGVKDNDFDEDALLAALKKKLGKRLTFAWAAVRVKGKTTDGYFPRAYHIKVAVKDKRVLWLSSGNWQSSNQPSSADFPATETRKTAWRKYNRDWHVVIEHPGLAAVFDTIIRRDYTMASKLQDTARGVPVAEGQMPLLFVPIDSEDLRADTLPVERAPTLPELSESRDLKYVNLKMRVQPLLTPDNYETHVLPLIKSATKKLYFINQSLGASNLVPESVLEELTEALLDRVKQKVDVRIILRDIGGVDADLATLKRLKFPMDNIRVQPALHTKGIVVDGQRVLIGSQNWTVQGVDTNRDASLIFDNKDIAGYFEARFDHDWERLARQKISSLTNPPRLLLDGVSRSAATPESGVFLTWDEYFGG